MRIPFALVALLFIVTETQACSGCGCKGGPGYRGPNGRCVGWGDIGRTCGSPPTLRCTAEGVSAGADDAADLGQKALQANPNSKAKQDPGMPK